MISRFKISIVVILFVIFTFAGCNAEIDQADVSKSTRSAVSDIKQESEKPDTPTPSPTATQEKLNSLMINDTGKTIICKANYDTKYNTSFMIVSEDGTVILTDPIQVFDGIKADIITISHGHHDHNDGKAIGNDDCIKVHTKETSFSHKGVNVTGVASAHGDYSYKERPNNVIYIFEVDGLRIAHMGDIGQKELSAEQLELIGSLDIIFMPCINLPEYGLVIENSVTIINQLNPKIIIPTHYNSSDYEGKKILNQAYNEAKKEVLKFAISKEDLNEDIRRFVTMN